ncbi:MAG: hypothetical protein ACYCQJ_02905 [Nitrososphaerales archaeon]
MLPLLGLLPAIAILAWVLYEKIYTGIWHSDYALLRDILLLFATQLLAFAMISLLVKRSEHRVMRQLRRNQ